jgi:hypothetical protein
LTPTKKISIPRKTERRLLTFLLLAFVGLWAWNVRIMNQAAQVKPGLEQASMEACIYVAALTLDAELQDTGRLPESLVELGVDREGLTYRPRGSEYELTARAEDQSVSFRSGEDLSPYEAAFRSLIPGGALP